MKRSPTPRAHQASPCLHRLSLAPIAVTFICSAAKANWYSQPGYSALCGVIAVAALMQLSREGGK